MANWCALPFEVKSLIIDAFIEYVLQDEGYQCFRDYDHIAVYHKTKECSIGFVDISSSQSEISTLLLAAPELQQEALGLIDKKLCVTNMLDNQGLWRIEQGAVRKVCILSVLRRQLLHVSRYRSISDVLIACLARTYDLAWRWCTSRSRRLPQSIRSCNLAPRRSGRLSLKARRAALTVCHRVVHGEKKA